MIRGGTSHLQGIPALIGERPPNSHQVRIVSHGAKGELWGTSGESSEPFKAVGQKVQNLGQSMGFYGW